MSDLLKTHVERIRDGDVLALISELEEATAVGSDRFLGFPLLLFLTQCVYPEGPTKRFAISLKYCLETPILQSRVGRLPDGALRDLCAELAARTGDSLEVFHSAKVYALLNKTLPRGMEVKNPGADARWDAVIRQRRANR
jgi:hypothetical protein